LLAGYAGEQQVRALAQLDGRNIAEYKRAIRAGVVGLLARTGAAWTLFARAQSIVERLAQSEDEDALAKAGALAVKLVALADSFSQADRLDLHTGHHLTVKGNLNLGNGAGAELGAGVFDRLRRITGRGTSEGEGAGEGRERVVSRGELATGEEERDEHLTQDPNSEQTPNPETAFPPPPEKNNPQPENDEPDHLPNLTAPVPILIPDPEPDSDSGSEPAPVPEPGSDLDLEPELSETTIP